MCVDGMDLLLYYIFKIDPCVSLRGKIICVKVAVIEVPECVRVHGYKHTSVCLFLSVLSAVLVSPQASLSDPLFPQRSTKRFPSCAANFQQGPDPHLDQLESICYCKYKFGNL